MTKTVLITIGRFPKALDVARALKMAEFRVIVADPLRHHLCRAWRSVDKSIAVTPPRSRAIWVSVGSRDQPLPSHASRL
jgi:hypothetical protein